jgi:hypothetical protein
MATNSSHGNPIAADDDPAHTTTAPPPPIPSSLKAEIHHQEHLDETASAGKRVPGQDAGGIPPGAHVETVEEIEGSKKEGTA